MKWKNKKVGLSLLVSVILLSSILGYQYGLSSVPASGPYYLDVPFGTASYYVGKFDNGSTYAVRGSDWKCEFVDSDASTVIQSAIDATPNRGRIYIEGKYIFLTSTLNITDKHCLTIIFEELSASTDITFIKVSGGYANRIIGQYMVRNPARTFTQPMINLTNTSKNIVDIMHIYPNNGGLYAQIVGDGGGYCYSNDVRVQYALGGDGILIKAETGTTVAHNLFHGAYIGIEDNQIGVKFEEAGTGICVHNQAFKTLIASDDENVTSFWNNGNNILIDCHSSHDDSTGAVDIENSGDLQVIGGSLGSSSWITNSGLIKWNHVYFEVQDAYTENSETATDKANGGTIAHGLAGTPTTVTLTSLNATYDGVGVIVAWDEANTDATNISLDIYWTNGTAISDGVIDVSWYAEYEP